MKDVEILVWAINESRPLMEAQCAPLLESAAVFGFQPTLFGIGFKHTTHKARIWLLHQHLKSLDPNTIVICMDGMDTLFNEDPDVLIERFLEKNTRILISAEKAFTYQYLDFKDKFEAYEGPYKFLNAGTFMGYAGNLFLMLEEIIELNETYPKANDQGLLGIWAYQNLEQKDLVQLDHDCSVFWVTTDDWALLKTVAESEPFIIHPNFGKTPCIIHCVGVNHSPHRAAYDAALKNIREIKNRNHTQDFKFRVPSGEVFQLNGVFQDLAKLIANKVEHPQHKLLFSQNGKFFTPNGQVRFTQEVIEVGLLVAEKYVICSPQFENQLLESGYIAMVPPEAQVMYRDTGKRIIKPVFRRTFQDYFHGRDNFRKETEEEIAPFMTAFHRQKENRLKALKELRSQFKGATLVIVTFNEPFVKLFFNLLASCEINNIPIRELCLFFPMDKAAKAACEQKQVPHFYQEGSYGPLPSTYTSFGHGTYRQSMFMKNAVVQDMLQTEGDLIFMDIDLVWLNNPIPTLEKMAATGNYDFLFMNDGLGARDRPLHYNTGFFYVKNNKMSRKIWEIIFNNYAVIWNYRSQQALVNQVILHYRPHGLRTRMLDDLRYINGHMFVPRYAQFEEVPKDAFVVHASWTRDMNDKLNLLKKHKLWYLDQH